MTALQLVCESALLAKVEVAGVYNRENDSLPISMALLCEVKLFENDQSSIHLDLVEGVLIIFPMTVFQNSFEGTGN